MPLLAKAISVPQTTADARRVSDVTGLVPHTQHQQTGMVETNRGYVSGSINSSDVLTASESVMASIQVSAMELRKLSLRNGENGSGPLNRVQSKGGSRNILGGATGSRSALTASRNRLMNVVSKPKLNFDKEEIDLSAYINESFVNDGDIDDFKGLSEAEIQQRMHYNTLKAGNQAITNVEVLADVPKNKYVPVRKPRSYLPHKTTKAKPLPAIEPEVKQNHESDILYRIPKQVLLKSVLKVTVFMWKITFFLVGNTIEFLGS